MENRKTFGQIITEHHAKYLDLEDDIQEYSRAWWKDIKVKVNECIFKTRQNPVYRNKDFYISIHLYKEKFTDAPRSLSVARLSCPTPVYKQIVYKHLRDVDKTEFLWSIPDKILYYDIINHSDKYLKDPKYADMAKFVILMESGELLKWIKKENGEKPDAVLSIKKDEDEC